MKTELTQANLLKFWSSVDKCGPHDCWEWCGTSRCGGYGLLNLKRKQKTVSILAHRLSFELRFGIDPGVLCVLHKCDNRLCVNPDHMFLGTKTDNAYDRGIKGRSRGRFSKSRVGAQS